MGTLRVNILVIIIPVYCLEKSQDFTPLLCAVLYSLFYACWTWLFGAMGHEIVLYTAMKFLIAWAYFWLLEKSVDGPIWWAIAIVGLFFMV